MTKCGFAAIIGRPSAGKSTLLNKMCGEKVAIVGRTPQTTRSAVRGIVNRSEEGQLIFIDTPGRCSSEKKMNKKLLEVSNRALADCDLALYVIDASRAPGQEEEETASLLAKGYAAGVPLSEKTIAAVNKMDAPAADFNRAKEFLTARINFPKADEESLAKRIFAISAKTGQGVDDLLDALFALAPQGPPQYDGGCYTDQDAEFRITEIIREQAVNRLHQELPHSLYVDIADMEFKEEGGQNPRLWVRAFIIVERESQKGMVVGKGGEMIKAIRLAALKNLKNIFDWKIDLDLRVKAVKDWRRNDRTLKRIIERT